MSKLYIVQTQSKTTLASLVKLVTRNKYSHIMISLDNKFDKMYGFGRKNALIPFIGGYVVTSKNGLFYRMYKNTQCRVFILEITKEQKRRIENILYNFNLNQGKYNYDFIGLVLRFLKIDYRPKNKYVCSNFAGYLLEQSGIYHFGKNTYSIKPQDFDNIKNSKLYYEGLLKNIEGVLL
ncbi:MAG: hypothetical protein IJZ36_05400 [Bacilli bacterium]|nr:hypothetical protein [Bacilli bacterium]